MSSASYPKAYRLGSMRIGKGLMDRPRQDPTQEGVFDVRHTPGILRTAHPSHAMSYGMM